MKKIFLSLAIISFSFSANAQVMSFSENSQIAFRKSPEFNDATTAGSKYFNEKFTLAKVNKGTQDFQIRYNGFTDAMEYKNGKDILELIKEQNTYFEFNNGEVYELFNYDHRDTNVSRYHQILVKSENVKVSKYKSIKLNPFTKASNSYDTDKQANYKPNKDAYFVTYNNQTIEFNGKAKDLEKLIPGKASEIKQYFKSNKVKENDTDMIKLGQFLSTL